MNDDQIFVRLLQIMDMMEDGHTGLDTRPFPPSDAKDHIPVRFASYADGIYVRAAAPEYADAVGGKVVKVGSYDWQEAMRRVYSTESHDAGNEGEHLAWGAKTVLNWPRLLYGLGLTDRPDRADFVIEKNGQSHNFRMRASAPMGEWYLNSFPASWMDARPGSVSVPLAKQHEDQFYWFSYLPEHRAVYFQFNLVLNGEKESLSDSARGWPRRSSNPVFSEL